MKTQSFGRRESVDTFLIVKTPFFVSHLQGGLLDYREKRENGEEEDNPLTAFPSAGFDTLDIESSTALDMDRKWPDKEGRYWWKLTCKDRREVNDFYWKEDEARGYPDEYSLCLMSSLCGDADNPDAAVEKGKIYIDKNTRRYQVLGEKKDICQGKLPDEIDLSLDANDLKKQVLSYTSKQGDTHPGRAHSKRYWFTVHHAPSGTKIEGFSAEPDKVKRDLRDGKHWSYIQYNECGSIKAWMEEKDRNYLARLQREQKQPSVAVQKEQCVAEEKRQQELKVVAVKKCSENIMSMWAASKTLISPSSSTSLNIAANEIKDELFALPPKGLVIAQANCSYQAKKPDQLSFDKGDELIVLKQRSHRWWFCESGGLQGLAPSSYLDIISQTPTVGGLHSGFMDNSS
jgi:hypothetical protein